MGSPILVFFHSNTKIFFFPLLLIPPPNFLRNSCKIPRGAAHGRGQPFPGQLKCIILITYSKFSCPFVSPHDVRGRGWTQHWSHSTRGASPAHGGSKQKRCWGQEGSYPVLPSAFPTWCPAGQCPSLWMSGKTTGMGGWFFTWGFTSTQPRKFN